MELMTHKLIDTLFLPFATAINKISEKKRDLIFVAAGEMVFMMHFFNAYNGAVGNIPFRYLYVFLFDSIMCGFMILASLPEEFHAIRFDKILVLPYIGFGLFALIAGLTKDSDHLSSAIIFLAIYPAFYFVWSQCDFKRIAHLLLRISKISFCIFLVVHLFVYPITGRKYAGIFYNTNGLAFYLTIIICCLFIELLAEKKRPLNTVITVGLFGIGCSLLYYTNSRTGQLATVAAIVFTLILLALTQRRAFLTVLIRRIFPMVLSVAIFVPTTLYISYAGTMARIHIQEKIAEIKEVSTPEQPDTPEQPELPGEEVDSTKPDNSQVDRIPDKIGRDPMDALAEIKSVNSEKFSVGNQDMTQYSTGRLEIWKAYLQHLTLWGHSNQDDFQYERNGEIAGRGSAHMTYLQYGYQFGVPSAIFLLLFNILAGIKSIIYITNRKDDMYAVAPFMIAIAYGITASLASIHSFSYMVAFYYYLWQAPLMTSETGWKKISASEK